MVSGCRGNDGSWSSVSRQGDTEVLESGRGDGHTTTHRFVGTARTASLGFPAPPPPASPVALLPCGSLTRGPRPLHTVSVITQNAQRYISSIKSNKNKVYLNVFFL